MSEAAGRTPLPRELTRTNFFTGRVLTDEDLAREQTYHREARYLHNRAFGFGIVEGLEVQSSPVGLTITPGFAIDGFGRELLLSDAVTLPLAHGDLLGIANPVVSATWGEVPEDPVPVADPATDPELFATWRERPTITIEPRLAMAPGAVVLAAIRVRRRKGPKLDLTVRDAFRRRTQPSPTRSTHG